MSDVYSFRAELLGEEIEIEVKFMHFMSDRKNRHDNGNVELEEIFILDGHERIDASQLCEIDSLREAIEGKILDEFDEWYSPEMPY